MLLSIRLFDLSGGPKLDEHAIPAVVNHVRGVAALTMVLCTRSIRVYSEFDWKSDDRFG